MDDQRSSVNFDSTVMWPFKLRGKHYLPTRGFSKSPFPPRRIAAMTCACTITRPFPARPRPPREVDATVKDTLASQGITATSSPDFTLVEPWEVTNGQGQPYKVFTPFSKAAASQVAADEPEGVPDLGRRQAVHLPGPNPPIRHGRHPWPNTGRPARPGRASD